MRVLVLGGTRFVGRHIVACARSAGHEVTIFQRGTTNPKLFPDVEHLIGDRHTSDLDALRQGEWDVVIDSSAIVPRWARESASLLAGRVGLYVFISSVNAYRDLHIAGLDESAAVVEPGDSADEAVTLDNYGAMKSACEAEVRRAFPADHLVIRAGAMAGPFDNTGRFTYWVGRMARGSPVLGPARPDQPIQVMHARDHAEFVVRLASRATTGVFNAVGPDSTFAGMLDACAEAAGVAAQVAWAPQEWLDAHDLRFPLVVRERLHRDGTFRVCKDRAIAAGLSNRPLVDTARSVLEWDSRRPVKTSPVGPSFEQEATLLAELSARRGGGEPGSAPAVSVRTQRSPLVLDLSRRGTRPQLSLLIATTPRTGSWMLADLLSATHLVGTPQEYFREGLVTTFSRELGLETAEITPDYLEAIFGSSSATGVWSAKLQPYDLTRLLRAARAAAGEDGSHSGGTDAEVVARWLPNPRYVHLRRRNSARQAMSWYRALLSNVWWEREHDGREVVRPDYPDFLQLHWLENQIERHEADWAEFFRTGGVSTLEIFYEDLVEDPQAALVSILEFLSVPLPRDFPAPAPSLTRMADSDTDKWVRAYESIRHSLPPIPQGWYWSVPDCAFVAPE